jgi:hypothetical protein
MSSRRRVRSRTYYGRLLRIGGALAAATLLVGTATATASAPARAATAKECLSTGTGVPWSYKGQKGTVYTVIGVNGASCSLGAKWLKRITASHGSKSPAGWTCLTVTGVGECQIKGGGIFEFTPKLKK